MTAVHQSTGDARGFRGNVAGLSLADVIQLNGNNRFSGCVTVHDGARTGLIFFRDGAILHAEQGGRSGEDAFYDIMAWSSGTFSLEANVSTTVHTIRKSVEHVLIEACRVIDERRAGRASAPRPTPPPLARRAAATGVVERLKSVPGVAHAVLMRGDGGAVEDTTYEGEVLAGKAAYVALIGNQLGAEFEAGPLRAAALHGGAERREHVVLIATQKQYVAFLVRAAEVGAAEAHVARLLGAAP
jgi:hypothetical protein